MDAKSAEASAKAEEDALSAITGDDTPTETAAKRKQREADAAFLGRISQLTRTKEKVERNAAVGGYGLQSRCWCSHGQGAEASRAAEVPDQEIEPQVEAQRAAEAMAHVGSMPSAAQVEAEVDAVKVANERALAAAQAKDTAKETKKAKRLQPKKAQRGDLMESQDASQTDVAASCEICEEHHAKLRMDLEDYKVKYDGLKEQLASLQLRLKHKGGSTQSFDQDEGAVRDLSEANDELDKLLPNDYVDPRT
jgi:hypothetical protein